MITLKRLYCRLGIFMQQKSPFFSSPDRQVELPSDCEMDLYLDRQSAAVFSIWAARLRRNSPTLQHLPWYMMSPGTQTMPWWGLESAGYCDWHQSADAVDKTTAKRPKRASERRAMTVDSGCGDCAVRVRIFYTPHMLLCRLFLPRRRCICANRVERCLSRVAWTILQQSRLDLMSCVSGSEVKNFWL